MLKSKKWYGDALQSPLWQRRRLEVLQRDNFTCTLCTDNRTQLAVHHLSYAGKPWEVNIDDLKTVCVHCHAIIHELDKYEILEVCKRQSANGKCWEIVVFTTTDLFFLYLFFSTDKIEIITVLANPTKTAA